MTNRIDIVSIAVSLALLFLVLELVRRRKLSEEYSFAWILAGVALLALAVGRERVDAVAVWLGIHYPPALLLLGVVVIVFLVSLYFTIAISRQREQIERLIEEVTLLSTLVRERTAPGPQRQARETRPETPASRPAVHPQE